VVLRDVFATRGGVAAALLLLLVFLCAQLGSKQCCLVWVLGVWWRSHGYTKLGIKLGGGHLHAFTFVNLLPNGLHAYYRIGAPGLGNPD
jgi:hypothetical protein